MMQMAPNAWRIIFLMIVFFFVLSPVTSQALSPESVKTGAIAAAFLVIGWLIAGFVVGNERRLRLVVGILVILCPLVVLGAISLAGGSTLPEYAFMPYIGAVFLRGVRPSQMRLLPQSRGDWVWCLGAVIVLIGWLIGEHIILRLLSGICIRV